MKQVKTSLIIPTLNRYDDLKRCLASITKLTQQFDEIIIVEQGDIEKTQKLAQQFPQLAISVYLHPVKSIAQAKNAGIEKAQGEFIFFIDDDTELDKEYVKVAVEYLGDNPYIIGLTGKITHPAARQKSFVRSIIIKILDFLFLIPASMSITAGGINTIEKRCLDTAQNCQWLSGGHMVLRKTIFKEGLEFCPHYIRWSAGEDVLPGYQVYKKYGAGSLKYLPNFMLVHHAQVEMSLSSKSLIKMQVLYMFHFWYSEIYDSSIRSQLYFLYQRMIYRSLICLWLVVHKGRLSILSVILKSYYLAITTVKNFKNNKEALGIFNKFILEDKT